MNITWDERPNSMRTSTGPLSDTVGYRLTGVFTFAMARAIAAGYCPMIRAGLWRTKIDATERGFGLWDIDVTWSVYDKKEPEAGDFSWSFDTTGGTKHITQGISHVQSYVPSGKTAVDHKGTIGVNENGDVEGVDVPDKSFKWTEHRQLLLADYGWTYAGIVDDLTGTINNAAFRGMATGTVLFAGAQGTRSIKDPLILDLTYHFEYQRSGVSLSVGDITGISKVGWQYLWVEYRKKDGGTANRNATVPVQVNVEEVLPSDDFSLLGIGTEGL
jgi:hypothetical protein